jgi:hypothetical protein
MAPRPLRSGQDAETAQALRVARDAAHAECDRLAAERDLLTAEVARLQAALDRWETAEPTGRARDLELQLRREQVKTSRLLRVLWDAALTPASARGIMQILAVKGCFPEPTVMGEAPPAPTPIHTTRAELATELKVTKDTITHLLGEGSARGHFGRLVITDETETEQRPPTYESRLYLLPGAASLNEQYEPSRRSQNTAHKADVVGQQRRQEAEREGYIATLEAALRYVERYGCPSCGGDLMATAHYCPRCRATWDAETLAGLPEIDADPSPADGTDGTTDPAWTGDAAAGDQCAATDPQADSAYASAIEVWADSACHVYSNNPQADSAYTSIIEVSAAPAPRPWWPCPGATCPRVYWSRGADGSWYCSNCGDAPPPPPVSDPVAHQAAPAERGPP